MPRDGSRPRRVADQIQRELSTILLREVSDPRVAGAMVSDVEVSADLQHAKVFVQISMGDDPAEVMGGLDAASGFVRRLLAPRLRLRSMPSIRFVQDTTMDEAEHIESLLAGLRQGDKSGGDA